MKHTLAFVASVCVAATCAASTTEIAAFDFTRCAHWHLTSDAGPSAQVDAAADRRFVAAQAIVERLPPPVTGEPWFIFSAIDLARLDAGQKFGACRMAGRGFECRRGFDFPLAGARFARVKSKDPSYVCAGGCTGVAIKSIHDMGYESMAGERNVEHDALLRRFGQTCAKRKGH